MLFSAYTLILYTCTLLSLLHTCICIYMYVYIYIFINLYDMCVYIYTYVHMHMPMYIVCDDSSCLAFPGGADARRLCAMSEGRAGLAASRHFAFTAQLGSWPVNAEDLHPKMKPCNPKLFYSRFLSAMGSNDWPRFQGIYIQLLSRRLRCFNPSTVQDSQSRLQQVLVNGRLNRTVLLLGEQPPTVAFCIGVRLVQGRQWLMLDTPLDSALVCFVPCVRHSLMCPDVSVGLLCAELLLVLLGVVSRLCLGLLLFVVPLLCSGLLLVMSRLFTPVYLS